MSTEALSQELPKPTTHSRYSRGWIEKEFVKVRSPGTLLVLVKSMKDRPDRLSDCIAGMPRRVQVLRETADALAEGLPLGIGIKSRT